MTHLKGSLVEEQKWDQVTEAMDNWKIESLV
jgi:hypothetical protein